MKQIICLITLLFAASGTFCQITFEKGYFISNNNIKTECLIKNYDWKNNPTKIEYKLNDSTELSKLSIEQMKEFGIYDFSRYVRADVKIDRSPIEIDKLNNRRAPEWSDEQVFLKELVCGDASLYSYTSSDHNWFFYSVNGSEIQQLICKNYLLNDRINTNYTFRQQIINSLQNENTAKTNINNINYRENELVSYFKLYNQDKSYCTRTDFTKRKRELFNLKLKCTAENSDITFYYIPSPRFIYSPPEMANFTFNSNLHFGYGLEAEVFLKYRKNTWSVIFEPIFETFSYKGAKSNENSGDLKLSLIDLPVGVRYHFYINDNLKYYINGVFTSNLCLNFNSHTSLSNSGTADINPSINLGIGAGASYRNFNLELRYYTNRQLVSEHIGSFWGDYRKKLALILGYRFYKKDSKQ